MTGSIDWSTLRSTALSADAASTAQDIKDRLPIAFVLEDSGIAVSGAEGRLVARCPFHDDTDPSFDIYGEGLDRWGCFPCGSNGDVIDLIGRLYGIQEFPKKVDKAKALLASMDPDWEPPAVPTTSANTFDAEQALDYVRRAQVADDTPLLEFLADKSGENKALAPIPAEWIRSEFRVGCHGDQIIMPFYTEDGELVAYKHRNAHSKSMSAPGSCLTGVYYGEWRDTDPSKTVVLCEGETDTWAAQYHLGDTHIALGLPTGAGSHPSHLDRLAGRTVVVAFDGDVAGRKAAVNWSGSLSKRNCRVYVVPLPDGMDVSMLESPRLWLTMNRPMMPLPDGIMRDGGVYYRPNRETPVQLSNWSIEPSVELLGRQGESAYEGILLPAGRPVTLSSHDLANKSSAIQWAVRHGAAWYGTDRDTQQLLGFLQAMGPYLSPGAMTSVVGLHDKHFVLPGVTIGPDNWKYVAPPNSVGLDRVVSIQQDEWFPQQVERIRALHQRKVMDPFLAWLALAPLRSLFRQFPILAVTGSSGTGKTTLVEATLKAFTESLITTNLTSTTPHALFSYVGSTNGVPVWFDEYRPGARKATMETLQQLIRDAYTGQSSSKGGMGRIWSEVTAVPASAPLIITGEDAFSETSHTERMVLVNLPIEGRNADVLDEITAWGDTGLPFAYLSWLQYMLAGDRLDLTVRPIADQSLPLRQRTNFAMLALGWSLLDEFVITYGAPSLGDPDFSAINTAASEAAGHNPIQDAVLWCLDESDAATFVFRRDGMVHIRVENFVRYVRQKSDFLLPGGTEAVRRYLRDNYSATPGKVYIGGKQIRTLAVPESMLESDDANA